jgi:hypothetical protein
MFSSISKLQNSGGIEAVESRMQQLENMVNAIQQTGSPSTTQAVPGMAPGSAATGFPKQPTPPSFASFMPNGMEGIDPPFKMPGAGLSGRSQNLSNLNGLYSNNQSPGVPIFLESPAQHNAPVNAEFQKRAAAFQPMLQAISQQHGVDARLVNAVVAQESGFNPQARSSAGAMGLMQLMPSTAQSLGVQNAADPAQNLSGGIRYLKSLLTQFNGNIPLALAAYNAGPGAVKHYNGVPPYAETKTYVRKILTAYLSEMNATPNA